MSLIDKVIVEQRLKECIALAKKYRGVYQEKTAVIQPDLRSHSFVLTVHFSIVTLSTLDSY